MKQAYKLVLVSIALTVLASATVFAQGDTLTGKYEGTAKMAGVADSFITLELKNEGGKISGRLMNGTNTVDISEGTWMDGNLSLKFGAAAKDGVLSAKVEADKLTGDWISGTVKKTVELKKVIAAPAVAGPPLNLNGEWDAVADAQGQPFPFLLVLKIDGEKVTGSSTSQLGDSNISTGSWKDGRLSFQLDGSNGVVTMSATVIDGKLSGDFDYGGQLQGKWIAVKKN